LRRVVARPFIDFSAAAAAAAFYRPSKKIIKDGNAKAARRSYIEYVYEGRQWTNLKIGQGH
jgi:hypothetical protein